MSSSLIARYTALLLTGFVAVGAFLYICNPLAKPLQKKFSMRAEPNRLANACVPDASADEDQIFFLSCGGIF